MILRHVQIAGVCPVSAHLRFGSLHIASGAGASKGGVLLGEGCRTKVQMDKTHACNPAVPLDYSMPLQLVRGPPVSAQRPAVRAQRMTCSPNGASYARTGLQKLLLFAGYATVPANRGN